MTKPLQITWQRIAQSDAIEAAIRKRADKLKTYYEHVMGCHVVIDAPHAHQPKGKRYQVRIDLTVPGSEIVVNRDHDKGGTHEDIYVAIRDAFDAAKRQLQEYARRQRGDVKTHEENAPPES